MSQDCIFRVYLRRILVLIALGNSDEQGGILISHWEVSYGSAPWVWQGHPGQWCWGWAVYAASPDSGPWMVL